MGRLLWKPFLCGVAIISCNCLIMVMLIFACVKYASFCFVLFLFFVFFTSASPRNFAINFYQWAPVCEKCENLDGRK